MRILRAAQRHGSGRSRAAAAHQRCACCTPFSSAAAAVPTSMLSRLRAALPNARDLNEAFPAIPPGRLIRCANPSSTPSDDVDFLLGELRVRDMIDLRAAEELREDDSGSALMGRTVMWTYSRSWLRPGQLSFQDLGALARSAAVGAAASDVMPGTGVNGEGPGPVLSSASRQSPPKPTPRQQQPLAAVMSPSSLASASEPVSAGHTGKCTMGTADPVVVAVRHNISLLDRRRYYVSLACRIPASTTATALLTNFISKPAARALLLPYVNGGGLPMLYEMLLESSRTEIRQVMEVLLRAAESRHCVMFFCRAGKDRTGLVAALVLAVAGASEEQIVDDYARSDAYHRVALAGLESREELAGLDRAKFERAPPEVMRATLEHVRQRYGSVQDYLTGVGFGPERQRRLRELLTGDW